MKTYTHFQSTAQFCALLIGLAACAASFAQTAPPASPTLTTAAPMPADEFLWLEDVQGERQLAWVRERNAVSTALLQAQPSYAPVRKQVFDALSATDKIPYVFRMGPHLYNLWTDASNKRGLLRRTTLAEYKKPQPAWETVLDIDALGAAEKENWVYKSISCARPSYKLCMLGVSRGGADATVLREFDVQTKAFVKDGFFVPEAKNSAMPTPCWSAAILALAA
jgi:prolyl oligopeptidase